MRIEDQRNKEQRRNSREVEALRGDNMEDAKVAWSRRRYPDNLLNKMTEESGVVMATGEERRERYERYRLEELQLLGVIQPGEGK